ncbi:hypothetical protein Pmani_022156 [Petrolisthes manimaculis]|uniref:Uncharacterized protein n=1 Tax=Petrolisthes manimaculis TaxID=1843537 RepID=A0AAE1U4J8_9EUCA|nr:hypothetical protein Pmani_022156 [Petrolisthes manimaculis]
MSSAPQKPSWTATRGEKAKEEGTALQIQKENLTVTVTLRLRKRTTEQLLATRKRNTRNYDRTPNTLNEHHEVSRTP